MLRSRRLTWLLLVAVAAWQPVGARGVCVGDCNGDGAVNVGELIIGVQIALGESLLASCPGFDVDADGTVALNELTAAVTSALSGCVAVSPTPARTATPPRPTVSASSTVLGAATPTDTRPAAPSESATPAPTQTPQPLLTASATTTAPSTDTPTPTASPELTDTPPLPTASPSAPTPPPTIGAASPTRTPTAPPTPFQTHTVTATPPPTLTRTATPTSTPTMTRTRTPTRTLAPSATASRTPTATRTTTPARTATAPPPATATVTGTFTRTASRTATTTRTPTPSPTVTPTFQANGPVITYIGIARADGSVPSPAAALADATRVFERALSYGFFIVVEARNGPGGRPVGLNTFDRVPGDPNVLPNLQLLVSQPLGNGSAAVCDVGPPPEIGGVPAVDPPLFGGTQASADAINDLACRFDARTIPNDGGTGPGRHPCTRNANGEGAFVNAETRVQFCSELGVGAEIAFPPGDTRVSARVTDVLGQPGPPASIIIRVLPK